MEYQYYQIALFMICLIVLIAFSGYSIRAVRRFGSVYYLRGLLFAVKTAARAISKITMSFIGLLATGAITSREDNDTDEDYLTGVYNFRTRKYDNGADPYGWYEEDL